MRKTEPYKLAYAHFQCDSKEHGIAINVRFSHNIVHK